MRTIRIKLYKFSELSKDAQEKAISDHIDFEISEIGLRESDPECNLYWPLAIEMEKNQTEWALGQEIYRLFKNEIISTIEANEYEFTKEGKLN